MKLFAAIGLLLFAGIGLALGANWATHTKTQCACTSCCPDGGCCCETGVCSCDTCKCDCCAEGHAICDAGCCALKATPTTSTSSIAKKDCACTSCCPDGGCCCESGVCSCDSCKCDCCAEESASCDAGCCASKKTATVKPDAVKSACPHCALKKVD